MIRESGKSRRRVEDSRFLIGAGSYVEDLTEPAALHAAPLHAAPLHAVVLRSPHAHARILHIDIEAAAALPFVAAIFTEADLRAAGIGPLPCVTKAATLAPIIVPPRPALAAGIVRHVGDPVAFVVAEHPEAARDAAEAIVVEYESLPSVTDGAAAVAPDAPLLWPEAPGNLAFRFQKGDQTKVAAAFAAAAHIVEMSLVNNRVSAAPLEPRAAIGFYEGENFTLHLTGQGVHAIRNQLAEYIFHVPPERIRLIAPDVGGGFGAKNFLYPEWVLVLFAARALGRPVRWVSSRTEDFLSSAPGRDNHTKARLALDAEGRILGLDVATIANMGAYLSPSGPGSSTNASGTATGGLYAIPAVFMDVQGVFTNTTPIDAYRGAGKPEANYVIERLIDRAARALGLDPVALRRRNLISSLPYVTAMGMTIDVGQFGENLAVALHDADHAGFPKRRAEAATRGYLRGIGVACFLETSRGAPGEMAGVRFQADGQVALVLGTQSNGQGHETSFPQIAADLLGLPPDCFRLVQADTDTVPRGQGHGGARSMHMGGAALVMAIEAAIENGRIVAGRLLQRPPVEIDFADGVYRSGETRLPLLDVARAAAESGETLDSLVDSPLDLITFPNGCHVAEVEIDMETGHLTLEHYLARDDYGILINPMLTEGQVQGGLTQGIGQALHEAMVHDPESGQPLAASFMDYTVPRAAHLPMFDIAFAEVATASNPLGVKGSGQAGCIAAPQTVINAVLDALAPLGVTEIDMPATPFRIWEAMRRVGRQRPNV